MLQVSFNLKINHLKMKFKKLIKRYWNFFFKILTLYLKFETPNSISIIFCFSMI